MDSVTEWLSLLLYCLKASYNRHDCIEHVCYVMKGVVLKQLSGLGWKSSISFIITLLSKLHWNVQLLLCTLQITMNVRTVISASCALTADSVLTGGGRMFVNVQRPGPDHNVWKVRLSRVLCFCNRCPMLSISCECS